MELLVELICRVHNDTDWIHQRLLSIRVRNELTAEWQERGVQQGKEIYKAKRNGGPRSAVKSLV